MCKIETVFVACENRNCINNSQSKRRNPYRMGRCKSKEKVKLYPTKKEFECGSFIEKPAKNETKDK